MMTQLQVSLFGRFQVRYNVQVIEQFSTHRTAQELFSYLLIHRHHSHQREVLAELLWGEWDTDRPGRCLRKALWQLRTLLNSVTDALDEEILLVEPDWIGLNPDADLWTDVSAFEAGFDQIQALPDGPIGAQSATAVRTAVDLYHGGLQEVGYRDWYLYERERFQHMYLLMLEKLMEHAEASRHYEEGVIYGMRILVCERAHERTHRKLMRLHCRAGDRTSALRQYERCVHALREELDVGPSRQTVTLYKQICADEPAAYSGAASPDVSDLEAIRSASPGSLLALLECMRQMQRALSATQEQVSRGIQDLEVTLGSGPPQPGLPKHPGNA
jgi:DNA-binding SARP family transcriptional activator